MNKYLITGGSGFIGSHFVKKILRENIGPVVNVDSLTYAAAPGTLRELEDNPAYIFIKEDITNQESIENLLNKYQPTYVVNFAAETHVDRSIDSAAPFIKTNVEGVLSLLEACRNYLKKGAPKNFRFLHISTDEVFGSANPSHPFVESDPYNPSSPYAASKAASDHLVRAFVKTYNFPAIITNCTNNYGPYQFPEKLIPHMILSALKGQPLPVYGDGLQSRDWLHVEDHIEAIQLVLEKGNLGESYNIAGMLSPITNLNVVRFICEILDELKPLGAEKQYGELIQHVKDRPGHDVCYALDFKKLKEELGWNPKYDFQEGLKHTVKWYLENRWWWQPLLEKQYKIERLGLQEK